MPVPDRANGRADQEVLVGCSMQSKTFGGARWAGLALTLALLPIGSLAQPLADGGLSQGRAEAARGDFYRALLTLKDATRQLEARPDARPELARAYANLAWAHLGMNQPEEAQAAVERALKTDPTIAVTSPDFPPSVVSLFDRARRPSEGDPEEAGRRALKAGRNQEALLEFQRALRALPASPPSEDMERLGAEIIETVMGMDPKPQVPAEATKRLERARELEEAQTLLGAATPASTAAMLNELEGAVRLAPWWPEALFGLAQAQHSLGRLDESLATLRLYKLADPAGRVSASRNPEPAAAAEPSATAATATATKPVSPGTLILYWTPQFKGGGRPGIKCDDARIADLAKGRMIRISAEPGVHTLTFYRSRFNTRVLADEVHYLRASVVGFPARPEIREVPAAEGEAEIAAKGVVLNEERKTYGMTCGSGKR